MAREEDKEVCLEFFKTYTGVKRLGFEESLTTLQNESSSRGLNPDDMEIIVNILTKYKLTAGTFVSLVKCLIPAAKVSNEILQKLMVLWFTKYDTLPITCSIILLQWLEGVWEHQLIDRKELEVYYSVFFANMLKFPKLESQLSRLVYMLTKPESVTRRQALRVLALQTKYSKAPKHIYALLGLFKSYKPDVVPEKIISVNIENVWKSYPEALKLGFEKARNRNISEKLDEKIYNWNPGKRSNKRRAEPLIPSIKYFHMGSTNFSNQNDKYLFDIHTFDDIGRNYFDTKLPTNSVSLLANSAGYHFLTFADHEYQSRFSHNLYNILRRAFIIEPSQFTKEQKNQLLDMTIQCCQYMRQGIPVVMLFLKEFLPHDTGEFRMKLLSLIEWSFSISISDLQSLGRYLDTIFLESSIEEKCRIIDTLEELATNLFINQRFGKETVKPSPFLGQLPLEDFRNVIPVIIKIANHLIIRGLISHSLNVLLLAAALRFYGGLNKLIVKCSELMLFLPPRIVIYGGFVSKSCAILSRVCSLMVEYRNIVIQMNENQRDTYQSEINLLTTYAVDISDALWNNQVFSNRHEGEFLATIPESMLKRLPKHCDKLLNLIHHPAILPYKYTLQQGGLIIDTKAAGLVLSDNYFPRVSEFIKSFDDFLNVNDEDNDANDMETST